MKSVIVFGRLYRRTTINGRSGEVAVGLFCRAYHPDDEAHLIALWNRAYAQYGGFVTRSIEHWRWSILSRPGVGPADILVAEGYRQICAYAVLGPGGAVIEFAVAAQLNRWRRRRAFATLLQALEERARKRGDDLLTFASAATDLVTDNALRDSGYVVDRGDYFSLGVLNVAEFIRRLLVHHAHSLPVEWCGSFIVEISPGGYRTVRQPRLRIVIARREVTVHDACPSPNTSDCSVSLDLETLTAIIFGQSRLEQAIDAGLVALHGADARTNVSILFSALTIAAPWYTPLADIY